MFGWLLEVIFNTKYWDYSDRKLNIKGRVCLLNSIYWGILGIVFIKFIHPGIEKIITEIPNNIIVDFTVICMVYIILDTVITTIKLIKVNVKLEDLEEINTKIQNMLPNISKIRNVNKTTILRGVVKIKNKNRNAIDELKQKREKLILSIEKRTKRIRKAFPNMKSYYIQLSNKSKQLTNMENSKDDNKKE